MQTQHLKIFSIFYDKLPPATGVVVTPVPVVPDVVVIVVNVVVVDAADEVVADVVVDIGVVVDAVVVVVKVVDVAAVLETIFPFEQRDNPLKVKEINLGGTAVVPNRI